MVPRWKLWLYPDLRKFDFRDQERALEKASAGAFEFVEIVGICLGLGLTAFLTRYATTEMGLAQRIDAILANVVLAIPLLAVLVGPFLVRRARRHLRLLLERQQRDRRVILTMEDYK